MTGEMTTFLAYLKHFGREKCLECHGSYDWLSRLEDALDAEGIDLKEFCLAAGSAFMLSDAGKLRYRMGCCVKPVQIIHVIDTCAGASHIDVSLAY